MTLRKASAALQIPLVTPQPGFTAENDESAPGGQWLATLPPGGQYTVWVEGAVVREPAVNDASARNPP